MTRRLVDLSHPIISGRSGHPGLPVPRIEPWLSHAASRDVYRGQAEFEITRLFLVGTTGTYLDSPRHRYHRAPDVADLPLERLAALPAVRFDVVIGEVERSIVLPGSLDELTGVAVLFRTGWDARWGTDGYWRDAPFVGRVLASRLVAADVALVGIDAPNVDDTHDASRPAHSLLLGAGIPIVEHLRALDAVPDRGFRFSAVPAPIRGATTMPVRAFAELAEDAEAGSF